MSKKSILIVDDDLSMCRVLCMLLGTMGYRCICSGDGREALERFREDTFDLVIADIMMPEMGGLELLGRIKESRPETPVVMMSAYYEGYTDEARKRGAFDCLGKPIEIDGLSLVIERALGGGSTMVRSL